jgi:hypothetical protein
MAKGIGCLGPPPDTGRLKIDTCTSVFEIGRSSRLIALFSAETVTNSGGDDPPRGGDRRARLPFEGWKYLKLSGFKSWRKSS